MSTSTSSWYQSPNTTQHHKLQRRENPGKHITAMGVALHKKGGCQKCTNRRSPVTSCNNHKHLHKHAFNHTLYDIPRNYAHPIYNTKT